MANGREQDEAGGNQTSKSLANKATQSVSDGPNDLRKRAKEAADLSHLLTVTLEDDEWSLEEVAIPAGPNHRHRVMLYDEEGIVRELFRCRTKKEATKAITRLKKLHQGEILIHPL